MPFFYYTTIYIFYLNPSSSKYLGYLFYLLLVTSIYTSYIRIAALCDPPSVCFTYSIVLFL